jgi:hypothetical protein
MAVRFLGRGKRGLREFPGKIYVLAKRILSGYPLIRYLMETVVVLMRRGPVVTVFGSCRQDSVQYNFPVTPIRDGLTYPHFTGEVLQAIAFCSRPFGRRPPALAFRNGQLGKRVIPRLLAYISFLRTDVFVVEIASALSYEFGEWVYHHEIYDNRKSVLARHRGAIDSDLLEGLEPVAMEWDQIRRDLERIVRLLGPKRVVFVTHFATRSEGKRFELAAAVEQFLATIGVSVINPSDLLERWTADELFVREPVLSHYTPLGHSIIGGIYRDAIITQFSAARAKPLPALVQVVDNSPEKVARHTFHGWGDIVLGAAYVFDEARRQGRLASVDWSWFSAAGWLDLSSGVANARGYDQSSAENEVVYLFHDSAAREFRRRSRVFTNRRPDFPLDGAARDFLKRSGVRPGSDLGVLIKEFLDANLLVPGQFAVLHFRLGDGSHERTDASELLVTTLRACLGEVRDSHNETLPVVVMSDHPSGTASLGTDKIIYSPSKRGHLGLSGDSDAARDGLADFFLMGLASKIYSASTYSWGSGFSLAASQLFDIPLISLQRITTDGRNR